ncbi:class I SAM-dependent RNA methyltransferase [Arthrobacter ginkgonis]|uniref:Class I SAM-dependent RNA methyltransferase n=1 Tax=Arthrobacter ginkgonis TaxID=1630594 RepID=A0ABP7CH50_9MICC
MTHTTIDPRVADPRTVELRIGAPAHGGHCVARHEGRVVFVRHALPGELVRARLTECAEEARFWRADTVEVLEASEHRVAHFWAAADALAAAAAGRAPVGGAEFGHAELGHQRELKGRIFREQLVRLGRTDPDAAGFAGVEVPDGERADGLGWRTRAAFSVDDAGRLAMNAFRSNELVPVREMPLAVDAVNALRLWELPLRGLARVEVAVPSDGGAPLVLFVEHDGGTPGLADRAAKRLAEGVSAAAITQKGGSASDGRGTLRRLRGRTWLGERAAGHAYRVTGEGFWQIHRLAADTLAAAVLQDLDPRPGQRLADLYAGAGLFTAPLADAVGDAGLVLSIEGAPGTSRDARRNLHGVPQALVLQGRVEKTLAKSLQERALAEGTEAGGRLDGVVLDPPRTGAGKMAVRQIAQAGPARISYVSCDPASFARDVADFGRQGYRLEKVRVLDLYPHTHHMETVGLLVRA